MSSAAPDLRLHCLPMSILWDARHQRVKLILFNILEYLTLGHDKSIMLFVEKKYIHVCLCILLLHRTIYVVFCAYSLEPPSSIDSDFRKQVHIQERKLILFGPF